MKNFLSTMLVVFICASYNVAQAVEHSTQENFNYVFRTCLSAIYETDDFAEVMRKGNDDVIEIRRQDCWRLEESIGVLSQQTAKGAESRTCALETRVMLQSRGLALGYYLDAMNAYRSGNVGLYDEYGRRMAKAWNEAERDRQNFRNKYGY